MNYQNFKLYIVVVLIFFTFFSYSERSNEFSKIINALNNESFSLAEKECLKFFNADEEDNKNQYRYFLAHSYCGQKKYQEVLNLLSEVEQIGKSIYWKSYALMGLKDYDAAKKLLDINLLDDDLLPERIYLKGLILFESGELNQAEETLLSFLKNFPNHFYVDEVNFQLARIYKNQNRVKLAKDVLSNLVALDNLDLKDRSKLLLSNLLFEENNDSSQAKLFLTDIINNNNSTLDNRMIAVDIISTNYIKNNQLLSAIKVYENAIGWANDTDGYNLKNKLVNLLINESLFNDALRWIDIIQAEALSKEEAIDLQFKKAKIFLFLERSNDAEFAYQVILDAAENNLSIAKAYYGRGISLWNLGRSEEAAYMFNNAYKIKVNDTINIQSILKAGDAYYKSSMYDEAELCYLKFIDEYPNDLNYPQALYQLGLSIARIGRRSDALNCFKEVCDQFPDNTYSIQSRLRIADILIAEKKWEDAIKTYILIEKYSKDKNIRAYSKMQHGLLLYQLGFYNEAYDIFVLIIKNNPASEHALQAQYLTGFCLYMMDKVKEALDICRTFTSKYPDSKWTPDVLFWLAQQAYNSKNFSEAEILFLNIFDNYFTHRLAEQSLFRAGKSSMKQAFYNKAVERFNLLVRSFPNSKIIPEARFHQGDALTELGEYARAILAYEEILKKFPQDEIADIALGRIGDCQFSLASNQVSRYKEALAKYQTLLERGNLSIEFKMQCLYKAGRCEMKLGNIEQGFDYYMSVVYYFINEDIEKSLSNLTWFTRSAFAAAELQVKINNFKGACAIYERVMNANIPSSIEAKRRYNILLSKNNESNSKLGKQ